ncbi:MAG: DUF6798 domain-containing protein [Bacteroidota bacterium]
MRIPKVVALVMLVLVSCAPAVAAVPTETAVIPTGTSTPVLHPPTITFIAVPESSEYSTASELASGGDDSNSGSIAHGKQYFGLVVSVANFCISSAYRIGYNYCKHHFYSIPDIPTIAFQEAVRQRPTRLALLTVGITIVSLALVSDFAGIGTQSGLAREQFLGIVVGLGLLIVSLIAQRWQQTRAAPLLLYVILGGFITLGYLGLRHTITLLNSPGVGDAALTRFVAGTHRDGNLYVIPAGMESFRLAARVPIFVDFKSHPYKDTELVEWFNRVQTAKNFYSSSGDAACSILRNISDKYKVTHVISKSSIANCGMLHELYADADFVIYEVHSR